MTKLKKKLIIKYIDALHFPIKLKRNWSNWLKDEIVDKHNNTIVFVDDSFEYDDTVIIQPRQDFTYNIVGMFCTSHDDANNFLKKYFEEKLNSLRDV